MSHSVPQSGDVTTKLTYDRDRVLGEFTKDMQSVFGAELVSVVLFGSAAENRIRPVSDVNVAVILRSFPDVLPPLAAETLNFSRATVSLRAMFLLENEVALAAEAFAVKFSDIQRRRRVLFGPDPFAAVAPSRPARIQLLRQTLLNQVLRLRARYAETIDRPAEAVRSLAGAAGPLRSAAFDLLELEGSGAANNREALAKAVGAQHAGLVADISAARETGAVASPLERLRELISCVEQLAERARRLS